MDQQAQPAIPPTRDERRVMFFSPAAKARREAAFHLSVAERDDAFREAARGWAERLAPEAAEEEIQRQVSRLFACCPVAKQAEAA